MKKQLNQTMQSTFRSSQQQKPISPQKERSYSVQLTNEGKVHIQNLIDQQKKQQLKESTLQQMVNNLSNDVLDLSSIVHQLSKMNMVQAQNQQYEDTINILSTKLDVVTIFSCKLKQIFNQKIKEQQKLIEYLNGRLPYLEQTLSGIIEGIKNKQKEHDLAIEKLRRETLSLQIQQYTMKNQLKTLFTEISSDATDQEKLNFLNHLLLNGQTLDISEIQ